MNSITKKCFTCGVIKPASEFSPDKRLRDGLNSNCKKCRSGRALKWHHDNPEKARQKHRRYYLENKDTILSKYKGKSKEWRDANLERAHEYERRWRAEHAEQVKAAIKKWVAKNKKKVIDSLRDWSRRNPEKRREYTRNRRVLKSGNKITTKEWMDVLEKYGHKCLCCGRSDVKITMDHVVPLKLGGTHTVGNVQPLCASCNSRKKLSVIDYRNLW